MKSNLFIQSAAAGLALLLLGSAAFAKPAAVTLLKTDGMRMVGYIAITNDKGLRFVYTENDQAGIDLTHDQVRAVSFTDEGDIMGPARHAYSRSNFEEAEQLFKAVAEEYEFLWGISRDKLGNFASEARFYQVECLRRLGRYAEMGPALETQTGKTLADTVNENLLPQLTYFDLWGNYASENWDGLAEGLKEFEQPLEGAAAELLSTPGFQKNEPSNLVQLSFMRGKLYASQDRTEDALREFYRAMILDYGADRILTKNAMESALRLQSKQEGLEESIPMKEEIHALAVMYSKGYNNGQAETWYNDFLKPVEKPEPAAAPAPAPDAGGEAASAPAADDAPPAADDAAPAADDAAAR